MCVYIHTYVHTNLCEGVVACKLGLGCLIRPVQLLHPYTHTHTQVQHIVHMSHCVDTSEGGAVSL